MVFIKKILFKVNQYIKSLFSNRGGYFYMNGRLNLGDSMVPWLINRITGETIAYSNPLEDRGVHVLTVGSILDVATKRCIVWGSGYISAKSKFKSCPKQILAVRGIGTKNLLQAQGFDCHNVSTGDPGLLVSYFYKAKKIKGSGKIAIIPHYTDFGSRAVDYLTELLEADLINIETEDVEVFCDKINQYDLIISSSLHGLIFADSYCIPNIWVEFSQNVYGNGFKFKDYFSNFQNEFTEINPVSLDSFNSSMTIEELISLANCRKEYEILEINVRLLSCFPGQAYE